jgi:hypothetical protein
MIAPTAPPDRHELWAELESVRRDINTLRYQIPGLQNPDHVDGYQARLSRAEKKEHELLEQLGGVEQA